METKYKGFTIISKKRNNITTFHVLTDEQCKNDAHGNFKRMINRNTLKQAKQTVDELIQEATK